MSKGEITYELPPVVRIEACAELHAFLSGHAGRQVILQCGSVERIGGQALQLIAAHKTVSRGNLCIQDPSSQFLAAINLLDLSDLILEAA